MSEHTCDHARHSGNRLEEDEPNQPFPFTHHIWLSRVMAVSCGKIDSPAQNPHRVVCGPVREGSGFSVGDFDVFELVFGGVRVWPCWGSANNQQTVAAAISIETYVNLMCGRFLGGGK